MMMMMMMRCPSSLRFGAKPRHCAVYTYIYMCVCMYVCMSVCLSVRPSVRLCVYVYVCMSVCMDVWMDGYSGYNMIQWHRMGCITAGYSPVDKQNENWKTLREAQVAGEHFFKAHMAIENRSLSVAGNPVPNMYYVYTYIYTCVCVEIPLLGSIIYQGVKSPVSQQ